jgi:DNA invertase Pin-like site-specific DNA recombinase
VKAVGYFREAPTGKRQPLAAQSAAFLDFCERQGYEAVATFVDPCSADDREPTGFHQMVEFLREPDKGFVVVVAPSLESLGESLRDAARRYFQIEGLGAQVAFMDGTKDTAEQLLAAWSKFADGKRLGDRVRAAMRRKAVRGEVLGRPPYGYKVGVRRRLELVPEEAVVVRYIFRLYLQEGLGIRLIARRLNEEELKTRRNGNWSMVSIRDILRNRAYLGTYTRFGVRVPGSHPALVSADDFRLVQERLSARRTSYSPRQVSPFLLSGLLHCGYCQNKMIGVSRRQSWRRKGVDEDRQASYRYYQCESRTNQSVCDYHTRRAAELEETVRQALQDAESASPALPEAGDAAGVLAEWQRQAQRVRRRLAQLDKRLEGYLDSAARGRLARERLRNLSMAVAADRLSLEETLEDTERRARQHATAADRRRQREWARERLFNEWDNLSFAERQELLRQVVERIVVTDDEVHTYLRP